MPLLLAIIAGLIAAVAGYGVTAVVALYVMGYSACPTSRAGAAWPLSLASGRSAAW